MADAFFKLLGSENPVNQTIGSMTQGIGFPLREVEPSISGGDVSVLVERVLDANSFVDQTPTTLGIPIQVTFGDAQATSYFSLDALGATTCLIAGQYAFRAKFVMGRRGGSAGIAQIYVRALIDGTPVGVTSHTIIDNPDIEVPIDYEGVGDLAVGQVLTFEAVRDTDANNSGGLYAGVPSVAGWASSPSARMTFDRFVAITP